MAKKKQKGGSKKKTNRQATQRIPVPDEASHGHDGPGPSDDARLHVRLLTPEDYDAVADLQRRIFPAEDQPWTPAQFASQLDAFPEGQFGIEFDGRLVAYASSILLRREELDEQHSYQAVIGAGDFANHREDGNVLYGIEIVVAPEQRGKRLARRLYDARKQLVVDRNLRSLLIAGRMPGYQQHAEELDPDAYLEQVLAGRLRDPVILTQVANGFVVHHVIKDYLPQDDESHGHAVLMEWLNPDFMPPRLGREPERRTLDDVRVAAVQYQMRPITGFDDFARTAEFFVETASDYRSDFICFPEMLTTQLLGLVGNVKPIEGARRINSFTDDYVWLFTNLAIRYNLNIIGGSHLLVEGEQLFNVAYLFRRDGSIGRQKKLHMTPDEATWWGLSPGDSIEVFDTDCGKIAILICYDIEFPELSRIVTDLGARIIFVPFNTDIRPAYLRVRSCAQARCIENNVYCVLSGVCGNLPQVQGVDIHYAQSCILTPSDIPYARDAIGAEATPNVETLLVHELDTSLLRWGLQEGATRNWLDRRTDLYRVRFQDREV